MTPDQARYLRTHVVDLRNQLQDVKSQLASAVTSDRLDDGVRDRLGLAIRSIQQISEDLAVVCEEQLGDPDRSFENSRAREAKSEVESGEFDMHG